MNKYHTITIILSILVFTFLTTGLSSSSNGYFPTTVETSRGLRYNYVQVVNLTLLFLEAQRSGKLPADNRIKWRGDSSLDCVGEHGEDLSGGYFEEGHSNNRSLLYQSLAMIELSWSLLRHETAYRKAGLLVRAQEALKWGADYFLKSSASNKSYDILNLKMDWTRPEEKDKSYLNIIKLHSSTLIYSIAGLAASSAALNHSNKLLSDTYMKQAKKLYDFLRNTNDTMVATKLDRKSLLDAYSILANAFLSLVDEENKNVYNETINETINSKNFKREKSFNQIPTFTYDILDRFQEAPECNNKLISIFMEKKVHQDIPYKVLYSCFVRGETLIRLGKATENPFTAATVKFINHALGDTGRSFLTGFGHNPPQRPYHIDSSCPLHPAPCEGTARASSQVNPHVLPGGLVKSYRNPNYQDILYFDYNSVFIFRNTRFHRVVTMLLDLHYKNRLPDMAYHCNVTSYLYPSRSKGHSLTLLSNLQTLQSASKAVQSKVTSNDSYASHERASVSCVCR